MPDYKEMYETLFRAQQECEELYLNAPEAELILLEQAEAEKK